MRETPLLALTRPRPRAEALLARIETRLGRRVPALIAPLLEVQPLAADYTPRAFDGLILTSAHGAQLARDIAGLPVWCVGRATARAARVRGARVRAVAADADGLLAQLAGREFGRGLLWLRGVHVAGDIAARLGATGIRVRAVTIYDQPARPPDPALTRALEGTAPVVLPLYSPRSARLAGQALRRAGPGLRVIALSPAVAGAWQAAAGAPARICARPDGEEMLRRIIAALGQGSA